MSMFSAENCSNVVQVVTFAKDCIMGDLSVLPT